MSKTVPFIRWAGGKTWLIKHLGDIIGNLQYNNYFEPFLGGAAVCFALDFPNRAYLSDTNEDLIDTYKAIKTNPLGIIEFLDAFENTEERYYQIRAMRPLGAMQRAARFIYLNQTSYNGLYRVNRHGEYNVPYGFRENWVYDTTRILDASKKLQKATLSCGDFAANKYNIKRGDLIFLDPPYTVSHNDNGFIEYNRKLFSLQDQQRLSKYIDYIKKKGAFYILTNAAHQTISEIFDKGDKLIKLDRYSLIGGKCSKREKTTEFVFTNINGEG